VERVLDRADRRVKNLMLTRAGKEHRARLLERMAEPPAEIRSLSVADQRALCSILQRVSGARKR
ncbi:MAG: MarR family transcriptional regulator, partial [Candidatus Binatia bacterium]